MVNSPSVPTDAQAVDRETYLQYHSFDEMSLPIELLRGIYGHGFEKPSEIQGRAIRPIIDGRDTIAQAQAGTGKTAAFIIGSLARINLFKQACQALILVPTRELASSTSSVVRSLGAYLNVQCHVVVGGRSIREDIQALQAGPQVVVGTPGRVCDMVTRQILSTEHLQVLVVDEADEMLSRGFRDQLVTLFQRAPVDAQLSIFSATLPGEVLATFEQFMRRPIRVQVRREELTLEGVRQFYLAVERQEWKLEALLELLEVSSMAQKVVYCRDQHRAEHVAGELRGQGYSVSALHGGLQAGQRPVVLQDFNAGASRVLVSTDETSSLRSIMPHVQLVINYDMPTDRDAYLRRLGRSGAYGIRRTALTFVTPEEVRTLREIEMYFSTRMDELPADIADLI